MPIGDIFDENLLGQIQQQQRQKAAQAQAVQQILLPALSATDPTIQAQGPVQPGQAPPTSANPQFEALLGLASGGREPGPLGRLEQTTGGGFLGDMGRFALGAVGDTVRGGPVGGSGLNEDVIRAIAGANQGNRQRDVQASRSERSFETDERIRQAKATPGRVPQTAGEKEAGKIKAKEDFRTRNPEGFKAQFPGRAAPAAPSANAALDRAALNHGFRETATFDDFGIKSGSDFLDANGNKPSPEILQSIINEANTAAGGQGQEVQGPPGPEQGGPTQADIIRDSVLANARAKHGDNPTPEQIADAIQEFFGGVQ